ncbi:forkhead box protein G [Trema orientale]|uniref:Forkhead box protein G n=1 Tax=Trema orientale TaxID=63057 RepID=A0A2P5BRS7_TREOI|nr:forkhead box protein G [Trema orientale]
MSLSFFRSILEGIVTRRLVLLYATTWTVLLTVTVAVASFAPEIAFVTAISPSSSFSKSCNSKGLVRIPLSDPVDVLCFPAHMVKRSRIDFFVPTVFAALVVAGSACVVRSFGLWGG